MIRNWNKIIANRWSVISSGAESTGEQVIFALCRCSRHSRERVYSIGGICGVWFVAGDWSVQSYRLAACLNVLRRVYSSYQFPGKYLHFRALTFSLYRSFPAPFSILYIVPTVALHNCSFPKDANNVSLN